MVADWRRRGTPDYIDGLLDEGGQTPVTAQELQSAASSEEDPRVMHSTTKRYITCVAVAVLRYRQCSENSELATTVRHV